MSEQAVRTARDLRAASSPIRGFVGIPFQDKGRSFEGCDCYGLAWLIFDRVAGIILPKYDLISSTDALAIGRAMRGETASPRWRKLAAGETPKPFDMVEMIEKPQPGARAWHCGIVAGPGLLLHTERGAGSHTAAMTLPQIAPRLIGFWRNTGLEARGDV